MIRIGIEREDLWLPLLSGRRAALCVNTSSYLESGERTIDAVTEKADVRCFLSLEHGLFGSGDAGENIENTTYMGRPVVSLYGEEGALGLPDAIRNEVDIILFDIQDLGLRFYTYIASLKALLEEGGRLGIPVMVFDRLNPFGRRLSGNVLKEEDFSFVGPDALPIEYGMTIGEVARFFNSRNKHMCTLTIIPVSGWENILYPESGRKFWQTSPAIESFEAAFVYSGFCLFEGVNLSEGRGTERPFRIVGAPFFRTEEILKKVSDKAKKGFSLTPVNFVPSKGKYKGEECRGLEVGVLSYEAAEPLLLALEIIRAAFSLCPECKWTINERMCTPFMDRLLGSKAKCDILFSFENTLEEWEKEREEFREKSKSFYLY